MDAPAKLLKTTPQLLQRKLETWGMGRLTWLVATSSIIASPRAEDMLMLLACLPTSFFHRWLAILALTAIGGTGNASAQQRSAEKKTPLDELKAADIPAMERFPWQPKGLVAVFGSQAWHYWPIGSSSVMHLTTDGKRVTNHAWNSIPGWLGDTMRVSDAATGKDLAVFKLPKDKPAKGAGISPSGRFVALCQENQVDWGATVWDVSTKKVQYRVAGKGASPA